MGIAYHLSWLAEGQNGEAHLTDFHDIVVEDVRRHVRRITLNRPAAMNAYTTRLCEELALAIDHYVRDDEVRVLIPVSYTHLTLPTICSV